MHKDGQERKRMMIEKRKAINQSEADRRHQALAEKVAKEKDLLEWQRD